MKKITDKMGDRVCGYCGGSGIVGFPNRFGEPDQGTLAQCENCQGTGKADGVFPNVTNEEIDAAICSERGRGKR